jgi:hypothetical protein
VPELEEPVPELDVPLLDGAVDPEVLEGDVVEVDELPGLAPVAGTVVVEPYCATGWYSAYWAVEAPDCPELEAPPEPELLAEDVLPEVRALEDPSLLDPPLDEAPVDEPVLVPGHPSNLSSEYCELAVAKSDSSVASCS